MNLRQLIFLLAFFNLAVWADIFAGERDKSLCFDFLSVGQGDSEIISTEKGVDIIIDGGPSGKILSEIEKSLGRKKYIDIMILTHPHADHYVGLAEVIERYKIGMLLLPEADNPDPAFIEFLDKAKILNISILKIGEGDNISSSDFKINILSPSEESLRDMNARSVVMMFEGVGAKALFTGDINSKQELKLVENYDIKADILKVSHHGSGNSSSAAFLGEVSPALSVIELGANNSYGFPKKETVDRLRAIGSVIYRADENGSIRVIPTGGKIKIMKIR